MNVQSKELSPRLVVFTTIWFVLSAALLEILARAVMPITGYFGYQQSCSFAKFRILAGVLIADLVVMAAVAGVIWAMSRLRPAWFCIETLSGVLALVGAYAAFKPLSTLTAKSVWILSFGLAAMIYRAVRKDAERSIAFFRRSAAWLAAGACITLLVGYLGMGIAESIALATAPRPAAGSPNVLLIVLDTFRADRTGAYGYGRGTTPFLDGFARQAIQYDKAFSTSSWTLPAHVSAFTGRRPSEHGAELFAYDGRFETIAQALAKKGYQTAGISANRAYTSYSRGVGAGFLHYENTYVDWRDTLESSTLVASTRRLLARHGLKTAPPDTVMRAEEVNRRFLNWVDRRTERPFFAFLNYMDTHFPRRPPQDLARRFPGVAKPITREEWDRLYFFGETPTPEMTRRVQDNYDGAVAHLDSQLRLLFDELKRRGLEKNLLVILTADHGESLGEHGLYDHRTSLYLEQVRIPLFVRFPGKLPEAIHIGQPVSLRQVAATIADFTGLEAGRFPGPELPVTPHSEEVSQESAVRTSGLAGGHFAGVQPRYPIYQGWIRSVVSGDLHFILQEDGKMELYDWTQDPGEVHNLVDSADHQLVERFKDKLLNLAPATSSHAKR